ncbi:MAG: glycosyltransferase [Candidatus Aenigmatarchaeota archaeon]
MYVLFRENEIIEMIFSLVLATVNRVNELENFLSSLLIQTYKQFELIICDQNEDGKLDDVIKKYKNYFSITHLKTPLGLSKSRNIGLKFVNGDIIAFPDDDCVYPKDLLEKIKKLFEKVDVDVLCVRPVNFELKTTAGKFLNYQTYVSLLQGPFVFCSFTMFMKKKVISEVGVFDENLGLGSNSKFQAAEDLDYGLRIIKSGFKVLYMPEIYVYHPEKEKEIGIKELTRAYRYSIATQYVLKKNKIPRYYRYYYLVRPLGGVLIELVKFRFLRVVYHIIKFYGRLIGETSTLK